jgi:hypothetical protein
MTESATCDTLVTGTEATARAGGGEVIGGESRKLVARAVRVHPVPSRTRQLSSRARRVLRWQRRGRVRRCQPPFPSSSSPPPALFYNPDLTIRMTHTDHPFCLPALGLHNLRLEHAHYTLPHHATQIDHRNPSQNEYCADQQSLIHHFIQEHCTQCDAYHR